MDFVNSVFYGQDNLQRIRAMGDHAPVFPKEEAPTQVTSERASYSIQGRLNRDYELYPMTRDEIDTCAAMLSPSLHSSMLIMPTHHINEHGELEGFRFNIGSHVSSSYMPLSRRMFFGCTMAECHNTNRCINESAIKLLGNMQHCRETMTRVLGEMHEESIRNPASFECMPFDADGENEDGYINFSEKRKYVDSKAWSPELPTSIGIYHGFNRSFTNDVREHMIYIVCNGGLNYASDDFYNLMMDVGDKATALQVCESEEVNWLRMASLRARCKIIKRVADAFDLKIPLMQDVHEYSDRDVYIAEPMTNTLQHDITRSSQDMVSVYNESCNTETSDNGILCPMHPCEGIWLFKGLRKNNLGYHSYGSGFGNSFVCGAFPTNSYPVIKTRNSRHRTPFSTMNMSFRQENMVMLPESQHCKEMLKNEKHGLSHDYFCFEEQFLKNLERMQWNRNNGIVELMPIIVGLG